MTRKKKTLITVAVILAVAVISGVTILAATNAGSSDDPLVTLSYLNNKFKPQVMDDVNSSIAGAGDTLSQKLDAQVKSFESNLNAASPGNGNSAALTHLPESSKPRR